ncbi:efflux RND transporter periplasmic adaptor subunit [bacterium]|nr:efflux transporter periplasmic adaptor subunit [Bacteroidota bacterium]MBR9861727.1 efflux RND transporter periplasmic adaptor subunit [bacterium]HCT54061.1 efflux RND transporter periplasmic adaptor subunit [Balneola sp.]
MFGGTETKVELQTPDEHIADSHTDDEGNVIYSCSMHPSVRQSEPGDCPICGMELIPVNDNSTGGNPNELTMSLAAMKLAEIETSVVRSGNPVSTIYLPGKIMPDQNKVSSVTALFGGRIVNLYVDYEGAFVRKGQKIASIYSPELISAQQELLQAAKFKEQNPVLYKSAKRKLALWELPVQTIEEIESTGEIKTELDIVSPATGYVTKLNVSREDYVNRGSMIYMVADLSSVWVMFDAYESDLSLIQEGQNIMFTTATYPGEKFEGTVSFVDPSVNSMSRTADVRVKANNPEKKLKPNMLAEGILTANISNQKSLLIPKSAVLWTGPRSIVFVQIPNKEEPTFIAREVTLGKRVGEQYIILEGLEAGEEVVTHGNFKLDGAAQLADKLSMMNRNPGTGANRTGHEGHNMGAGDSGEMKMEMNSRSMNEEDHSNHQNMNTETKSVPAEFKSQLNNVVQEYLKLKDALVMSDKSKVTAYANKLENELKNVNMTLVKGELHTTWMKQLEKIDSSNKELKQSQNIEAQRAAFLTLSSTLIESVKTFGIPSVIFQQYCPMTDEGKGGYWLSETEEIANPYFGDQMHNCGETILKIES